MKNDLTHFYPFQTTQVTTLSATALLAFAGLLPGTEDNTVDLTPVTVIAHQEDIPLRIPIDPRSPAQPAPSQDGADVLRAVPGIQVIRKGGTDGDPLLRGMAGSRLGIVTDGELCFGGCGNRMDPPTAYIHPALFDRVTVWKGPQTVQHGPGNSAGIVLFETSPTRVDAVRGELTGHGTAEASERRDFAVSATWRHPFLDTTGSSTWASGGDYEDGSGQRYHSAYERWSTQARVGWWIGENHRIEWTGTASDGEAAYADRAMDGVAFTREHSGLRWYREDEGSTLRRIAAQFYYNDVDHVMDNFSLRTFTPSMMMPGKAVSNPDRRTIGGKFSANWSLSETMLLTLGSDYQENRHRIRKTGNEDIIPYRSQAFATDADFSVWGLFGEWQQELGESMQLIAGLRHDQWEAKDHRLMLGVGMMGSNPNPTAMQEREESLTSGFLRIEHQGDRTQTYLGLGHSERFPDYWELFNKESGTSLSAFGTMPERTTQIDAGMTLTVENLSVNLAVFHGWVRNFILIESGFLKPTTGMNNRMATISRNVDATTLGLEATAMWSITPYWRLEGSLAWVRGDNTTDDLPLAQQPPLEARLSLQYHEASWSAGALLRLVAEQERFVINQGNIVGQDLGPTPGFESVSIFASWMPRDHLRITAGVDNLFDTTFAEHLSRGGATIAGFPPPTLRLNEPGRSWWFRCGFDF